MGRKLSTTALIDGVVYEAGTDESEIVGADTVSADVWAGEGALSASPVSEAGGVSAADVAALREQYDVQLAERDQRIAEITAALEAKDEELEVLMARVEATAATEGHGAAPGTEPVDYSALDIDALKAEIDKRNEGRDDGARISKRGSQETLAAALVADDTAVQQG